MLFGALPRAQYCAFWCSPSCQKPCSRSCFLVLSFVPKIVLFGALRATNRAFWCFPSCQKSRSRLCSLLSVKWCVYCKWSWWSFCRWLTIYVNDECDVHEVDVGDDGDAKDVGDVVWMRWKMEFGSSSLGKTCPASTWLMWCWLGFASKSNWKGNKRKSYCAWGIERTQGQFFQSSYLFI